MYFLYLILYLYVFLLLWNSYLNKVLAYFPPLGYILYST